MTDIKAKVDELAKWTKLAEDCKREIEMLKGEFDKLGTKEMADKKIKQVEFWGSSNNKVVVTESETLKVQYDCVLEELFAKVKAGLMSVEPSYKYKEPFKKVLIALIQGTYIDERFASVIKQIPVPEDVKEVLKKKLKGNWKKDINILQNIGKLSNEDSEYYSYQIQESMNYEKIVALLKTAGYEIESPEFKQTIDSIKAVAIVETGIKISVEADDEVA